MAASDIPGGTAGLELEIVRDFDAPPAAVFELWTDCRHLAHWWGPRGFAVTSCAMDFRPGGAWRSCIRSAEGNDWWMGGVYREIDPARRIVLTFAWDDAQGNPTPETMVTVSFAELMGGTRLTFHQAPFPSAAARDGHEGGWTDCLDLLGEYLAKLNGKDNGN